MPIREETRQRVLAVAAELGYRPNLLARGLRGSRSSLLGVIARDISDPFHIQILRGINEVARERDYRLFLGHVDYRPDVGARRTARCSSARTPTGSSSSATSRAATRALDELAAAAPLRRRRHRPDRAPPDPGRLRRQRRRRRSSRSSTSGSSATARSCACPTPGRYDGRLRIELYERFMREHGAADRIGVFITDQEPRAGARARPPDASRDSDRRIVRRRSTRRRTRSRSGSCRPRSRPASRIPDELSIVGFDDIDVAAFTIPPLTTISQDGVEMGRTPRGCCST